MLRFHRFHVPVAAERPALLVFLPTLCGCCAPECTDYVSPFIFSYARGRYALIGRFPLSRDR